MQSTIDNFIQKDRINVIEGTPDIVELTNDKGEVTNKYYKLNIE